VKVKLKGRHFDTVEVTKADSQAVLNSLTEHGIQDAFKYWQKRWERAYSPKRTSSRAMVASRPKVSFYQMAAPVPGIMDGYLYFHNIMPNFPQWRYCLYLDCFILMIKDRKFHLIFTITYQSTWQHILKDRDFE
jgi:hypothetical protein